jgi:hypothetical protein
VSEVGQARILEHVIGRKEQVQHHTKMDLEQMMERLLDKTDASHKEMMADRRAGQEQMVSILPDRGQLEKNGRKAT